MSGFEEYEHRAPHVETSQPFDARALLSQAPQQEINLAASGGAAAFLDRCPLSISDTCGSQVSPAASGRELTPAPGTTSGTDGAPTGASRESNLAGVIGESAALGPAYTQTSGTAPSAISDWLGQNPRVTQAMAGMIRDIPHNPMMAGTDALIGFGAGLAADYASQHSEALTRPWRNIASGQGTIGDYAIAGGEVVGAAGALFLASRAPAALGAFRNSLAGEVLRDTPWIAQSLSRMAILRMLPDRTATRLANYWWPPH